MRHLFCLLFLLSACAGLERIQLNDADPDDGPDENPVNTDGDQVSPLPPTESCRARGFNFICWHRGCFQEEEVPDSLDAAAATGANWLAIVPTWYQASEFSNAISMHATRSPDLAELSSVIAEAKGHGFQILLKPHIDLENGSWRGTIAPTNLNDWQESYRNFIFAMADLSEEEGVEVLAIGTELKTRSGDNAFWRDLIADLRERYSGRLTYAANWDEYDSVDFWDLLDYVGIDFYFPLTGSATATEAQMEASLEEIGSDLETFASVQGKPFLITEIGFRNVDGTNTRPYDYSITGARDDQEQADAYQAVLNAFSDENWLEGMFWWRWDIQLSGASDEGYLIYGKPAADILEAAWTEEGICGGNADLSPPAIGADGTVASFLAMGDWGTGGDEQQEVADAMQAYCETEECEFVLTLGDNFYSDGVESTVDPQWEEKFRSVYDPLGLPFYVVLGNHDTNGNIQAQIDYSAIYSSWYLPAENYSFTWPTGAADPLIEFFIFNSEYDYFEENLAVRDWLEGAIASSRATWKIVAMHHPIYSDGNHGDTDYYNNDPDDFLFDIVCDGRVDLVLSGHDHSFHHLRGPASCPIEQLVIGTGGASIRTSVTDTAATVIRRGNLHGFGWFQVTESEISFQMIHSAGATFYTTGWSQ
ncbi:MAG: metallophosphoesterase [Deltaproteobacteria bacterium]|nr:metallophosphoesterase [Deltaproteobacteria bacterium]